MRALILLLALLLVSGCHRPVSKETVTDLKGANRLVRFDQERTSVFDMFQGVRSFDFDSLVWQTNAGGVWRERLTISRALFQAGCPRERWVSQIESLDAIKRTAIIKVAEGDAPRGSRAIHYIYSWREWNLLTNGEVRFFRDCTNPFEKY